MPKVAKVSFFKMLENKWYHLKVLPQRFHLNGHTTGYFAQTQKLEQLYQTTLLPLAVLSGEGQFQAMLWCKQGLCGAMQRRNLDFNHGHDKLNL